MTDIPAPEHDEAIAVVVTNLAAHFPDVDESSIRTLVAAAVERIASDTKAPSFVAVLAEKEIREVLESRTPPPAG